MPSQDPNWYVLLKLPVTASTEQLAEAVEVRSRQASALAATAPERSQMLREQVRAMKRDLLQGDDARRQYDQALLGLPSQVTPDEGGTHQATPQPPPDAEGATLLFAAPAGGEPNDAVSLTKSGGDAAQTSGPVPWSDIPEQPPTAAQPEGAGAVPDPVPPPSKTPWWAHKKRAVIASAAAVAVIAAVGIGVAAASGGGSHHDVGAAAAASQSTAAPSTVADTPTEAPITEAPTTDDPSPSATPTPQAFGPGDQVLSSDDLNTDCGAAAPDGGTATDDSDDSSDSDQPSGSVDEILPDATVILDCSDSSGDPAGLAAVAARSGAVLWSRTDLPTSQNSTDEDDVSSVRLSGGGKNIYVLRVTDHPAVDLKSEYWTRTVTAIDAHTGKDLWTTPLERGDKDSDNVQGSVEEDPEPASGRSIAIVNVDDYSGFDTKTGALIWERGDLSFGDSNSPFLAGYDRALDVLTNDNGDSYLACTDLTSGKRLWNAPLDDSGVVQSDNDGNTLVGFTYWFINDTNFAAYDLLNGRVVARGAVPSSFSNALITPRFTEAQVGSTLRLYRTGSFTKPLWSVASDGSEPQFITSKSTLVQAPAGEQLLSAQDGQVVAGAPTFNNNQGDIEAGLLVTDDGVYEVGAV